MTFEEILTTPIKQLDEDMIHVLYRELCDKHEFNTNLDVEIKRSHVERELTDIKLRRVMSRL